MRYRHKYKQYYFYGRPFIHINGIYKPKHETEHIIVLLDYVVSNFFQNRVHIIEIGCGTGCIGITALIELNKYNIYIDMNMIDININAIRNTVLNIAKYKLNANLFNYNALHIDLSADIIITNPPYLEFEEFNLKYQNSNNHFDMVTDYFNCVGGIKWINNLLSLAYCKFIILEISNYQVELLDLSEYRIIKLIKPFVNSKIVFILLMHL